MKDKSKRLTVVNTEKKPSEKKEVQQVIVQPSSSSSSHAPGFNPNLYLLKSVWDSVFEIKTDVSGQKYIFGKLPVVTKYGITMYADDGNVEIPQLAEGLPYDQRTIWFNPETKQIEVIGGTGGGGEGGVTNFWDLSGIPSWITSTKPTYSYSEILGTPDLSVFITDAVLGNTLADYTTLSYLTGELKKYVTLDGEQDITGVKDFINGLKVGGLPITKKQDDVVYLDANLVVRGGITMYGDGEGGSSVPLYSTLGSLENVDKDAIDAVASVDRVLFQSAGSNVWSWKALSDIGGGSSSGGSVSGAVRYLSTLGSTGSWYDSSYRLYGEWGLHDRLYLKTEGGYDVVANLAEKDGNGNVIASTYLPLSGGTLTGNLTLGNSSNTSHIGYYINRSGNTIGLAPDYNCACLRFATSTSNTNFLRLSNGALDLSYDGGTKWNNILHSGNISSYNAGSATKLQTARTIWGKAFDGTADITTGDITAYAKSGGTTSLNLFKASGDVGWQISGRYSSNQSGLRIYYFDKSNYNEYLHIGVDGNIGVHTNTPGYAIDINGGLGIRDGIAFHTASSLTLLSIKNANNYGFYLKFHSNQAQLYNVEFIGTYGSQNYIDFGCGAGSNTVDAKTSWMRLIKGKLGIGTLDPSSPLHVIGDAAIRDGLYMARASDNSYNFFIGKESGTIFQILNASGGGEIHLRTNNSSTISSRVVIGGGSTTIYNTLITKSNITLDKASDNNASINLRGTTTDLWQISARYGADKGTYKLYYYNGSTWAQTVTVTSAGNVTVLGGVTMYSDQRKKTILNHVELSLKQIADAPLIEHYYNSDQDKTTHVGSIAQYWAQINDWFCKLDNEGYYTMEIQNCALASAISIARHLEKYESKTDKKIRMLKKRVKELEDKLERLEGGNYGCN